MTRARLLAAGVAGFVLTLLLTAPAELLRGPLQRALPLIQLGALHGHALSGRAIPAEIAHLPLDKVTWRWRPLALITGRLAFDLTLQAGEMHLGLRAARHPWSDEVILKDITGELDLERLGDLLPSLPGRARGTLLLDDLTITLDQDGWPYQAMGRLQMRAVALTAPIALPIGDAEGTLGMDADRFKIDFTLPPTAAIAGRGSLLLAADGGYQLAARLTPGASASEETGTTLRLTGRQERDGSIRIDQQGKLR